MSAPSDLVAVIGAGTSAMIFDLPDLGDRRIIALDISASALDQCREEVVRRFPDRVVDVTYIVGDVRDPLISGPVDVWYDRATFHFLTQPADQRRYADHARGAIGPGGHLLLAEFAEDGPEQCSGLPVARHDVNSLSAVFVDFEFIDTSVSDHVTPWGAVQRFRLTTFRAPGPADGTP